MRRDAIEGVTLDPIGFKIGLEVIAKANYGKAIEVPYVFTDRVAGESKLNQREIFNYLKQLRRLYAAWLLPHRQGAQGLMREWRRVIGDRARGGARKTARATRRCGANARSAARCSTAAIWPRISTSARAAAITFA